MNRRAPVHRTSARRVALNETLAQAFVTTLAVLTLLVILFIAWFVMREAWPVYQRNGFGFFGTADLGKDLKTGVSISIPMDVQLNRSFSSFPKGVPYREIGVWPAILGTFLTTGLSVLFALPLSLLAAVYIAELAPKRVASLMESVVRLLSGIPSVIFGLIALYEFAPLINDYLIDRGVARDLRPSAVADCCSA